ncbi:hypothetical protein ILUMI_04585 [Ignelater luminosus]|uniref:Uncharacterized protein n=1 Tax=Ignelater luminosus TaxID=2038154 RepID=A0A8K0D8V2_IGNLU|nr:hypothetical protein ILUMI_04585 [Ignelater luminosus]
MEDDETCAVLEAVSIKYEQEPELPIIIKSEIKALENDHDYISSPVGNSIHKCYVPVTPFRRKTAISNQRIHEIDHSQQDRFVFANYIYYVLINNNKAYYKNRRQREDKELVGLMENVNNIERTTSTDVLQTLIINNPIKMEDDKICLVQEAVFIKCEQEPELPIKIKSEIKVEDNHGEFSSLVSNK